MTKSLCQLYAQKAVRSTGYGQFCHSDGCRSFSAVGRFISQRQQRLEMRRFRFLVDDGGFDAGEAGAGQQRFDLRFGEAEPLVGVNLASLFEAVAEKVENHDPAAGLEDSRCLGQRSGRVQRVVKRLREEDEVDFGVGNGNLPDRAPLRSCGLRSQWR